MTLSLQSARFATLIARRGRGPLRGPSFTPSSSPTGNYFIPSLQSRFARSASAKHKLPNSFPTGWELPVGRPERDVSLCGYKKPNRAQALPNRAQQLPNRSPLSQDLPLGRIISKSYFASAKNSAGIFLLPNRSGTTTLALWPAVSCTNLPSLTARSENSHTSQPKYTHTYAHTYTHIRINSIKLK